MQNSDGRLRIAQGALLFFGASAWNSFGCSVNLDEQIDSRQQRIILGQEATPEEQSDLGIIEVISSGGPRCTGTLLTNSLVLTAHHCVRSVSNGSAFSPLFGVEEEDEVSSLIEASILYEPSSTAVSPGRLDFAVLELERPIKVDGRFSNYFRPLFSGSSSQLFGLDAVRCYGFGFNELATNSQYADGIGTLRSAEFEPVQTTESGVIEVAPNWLNASEYQMIAPGDSGGPCIDSSGAIVGITSWGDDTRIDLNQNGIGSIDEVSDIHAVYLSSALEFRDTVNSFYRSDISIEYRTVPADLFDGPLSFSLQTPAVYQYGQLSREEATAPFSIFPDGTPAFFENAGIIDGDLDLFVTDSDNSRAVCESVHRSPVTSSADTAISATCYDAGVLSVLL